MAKIQEGKTDKVTKPDFTYLIIGSGFAGLGIAIKLLKESRSDFIILEKANAIGGTWRDNTYPGCQCDVPSHLYSFSFELNPEWSRSFAPQEEIRRYLEGVCAKYNLEEKIKFNSEVTSASFDENGNLWKVTANGKSFTCRYLISATGPLSMPKIPDIEGLSNFKGPLFHSANWDHSVDLRGKRVAVVGTGASAIQIVPSIADLCKELYVIQRTPAWVVPRPDRKYTKLEKRLFRHFPPLMRMVRYFMYFTREMLVPGLIKNPKLLKPLEKIAYLNLKRSVKDSETLEKLRPTFSLGCKRILLSNEYYPTFSKNNVHLVSEPLLSLTPDSIKTLEKEIKLDVIIFATGFYVTDNPEFKFVFNSKGVALADYFKENGMHAYYGTLVPEFPNLFTILGPNTGLGHNSMIFMIESQCNFIAELLKLADRVGSSYIEANKAVTKQFNEALKKKLDKSVWNSGCFSWYLDEKGNNPTMWPGYTFSFWAKTKKASLGDFDFKFEQALGKISG